MGMPTSELSLEVRNGEPLTRTGLLLEAIALRQQIAVLERSRTRRPVLTVAERLRRTRYRLDPAGVPGSRHLL